MSYLYYCGSTISGPWFEYKDFMQMIRKEGDFKEVPSTLKAGLSRYFNAWLFAATGTILAQFFDEKFTVTKEFAYDYNMI